MVTKIGLDLGYANIAISDVSLGVYRVPSVAIIDKNTRRIVSVGDDAMMGNGAENGMLVRPFKNGLFYSAEFTQSIIKAAVRSVSITENVRCIVGVPDDLNQKQERELADMFSEAGISECFFVKRAVAALIGAGLMPTASAISVNIGASATEIAILYKGEIIYSATAPIGGEAFDEAVKSYMLEEGELNISLYDARAIKEAIGAVWDGRNAPPITVSGSLALTGTTIKMTIGSEDILGVFENPLRTLLQAIADGVKKIPTDYVEEIFANGIVLSGGGAQLYGLDKMISKVLGVSVTVANNPADCVVRGLSLVNTFLPIKMRNNGKNMNAKNCNLAKNVT
jgi:rod shape-determining protein MreB